MNFFDKMYVGLSRNRYSRSDDPRVLGFAVPYGTTKAEKKRMETVDRWKDSETEARTLDNTPIRGFKLVDVVSRYSTSNKLFRIQDPRGFELEIPADNLLDIAMNSTIVNGEIIEECVWATSGKLYLIPSSSCEYKRHIASKTLEPTQLKIGEYYVSSKNITSIFRYEGFLHHTWVDHKYVGTEGTVNKINDSQNGSYYSRNTSIITIDKYTVAATINMNSGKKPIHVYTEFRVNEAGDLSSINFIARKTKLKDLIPHDDTIDSLITTFEFNPLAWSDRFDWYSDRNDKPNYGEEYEGISISEIVDTQVNTKGIAFFKTKEEASSFDYSDAFERKLKADCSTHSTTPNTDAIYEPDRTYHYYGRIDRKLSHNVIRTIKVNDKR